MGIKTDELNDFINVISDILFDNDFLKLKNEYHHGNTNRYDHSIRVSLNTYRFTKKKKLDYVSATRGALLHDFFLRKDVGYRTLEELTNHSKLALKNAIKKFNVNEIEQDIIKNHMFPLTRDIPKSKEAKIVSLLDKKISFKESLKFNLLKLHLKKIEIQDIDFNKNRLAEKEVINYINSMK